MATNWNENQVQDAMTQNIRGKFKFIPSKCPGMHVHECDGIQYVDCSAASDTFNTVYGRPGDAALMRDITTYYRERDRPAAWWLCPETMDDSSMALLRDHGWAKEEQETGMFLVLPPELPERACPGLTIQACRTAEDIEVFGHVLASIFEDGNPSEAENVRAIYARFSGVAAGASSEMVLLNGYAEGQAVATAVVFFTGEVAGIFDIATRPEHRCRGFGSAMFAAALHTAAEGGARLAVLQASPDGLNIYQRAGFNPVGTFEVWNLPRPSIPPEPSTI
jgi:ribosomal protein S18 acetylase RimI-like enzyme